MSTIIRRPAPPLTPEQDRPDEFPFSEFAEALEKVVERLKPPRVRNACRNAFVHLRRSWSLHPVDAEMSLFRAITSEEEAATAVIHALKQQRYPGAEYLNARDHVHKSALWPFIRSVEHGFAEKGVAVPKLYLATKGKPKIELEIDLAKLVGSDEPLWAQPVPPLNFVVRSDRTGPFEIHRFTEEAQKMADDRGASDIGAHIKQEANLRNRLIYASDEGIPSVSFSDTALHERARRVSVLCVLAIAVMQTQKRQSFVVQCLESLLKILGNFKIEDIEYPKDPSFERPVLTFKQKPDGLMQLSLVRRQKMLTRRSHRHQTWPKSWG